MKKLGRECSRRNDFGVRRLLAAPAFGVLALCLLAGSAFGDYPGTLHTWGANAYGQLGDNTTVGSGVPVRPKGPGGLTTFPDVILMTAGDSHTMVYRGNDTVWACGWNFYGQLGDNTTTDRKTVVQVKGVGAVGYLSGVAALSAGAEFTLALRTDGTVVAWGNNNFGQLGDNSITSRSAPVVVKGPGGAGTLNHVVAVSGGRYHSLALKDDGTVWAWGYNAQGQLGDNTITARQTPGQVLGVGGSGFLTNIVGISAGEFHSMSLRDDGTVRGWGNNGYGQIGNPLNTYYLTPIQTRGPGNVGYLTGIARIEAGNSHTVALATDTTLWAWGMNLSGSLGDGTFTLRSTPVHVVGPGGTGTLSGIVDLAAANGHTMALKSDGTVWAWGENQSGEVGDNSTTDRATPVQVRGVGGAGNLLYVVGIDAGGYNSMASVSWPVVLSASTDWNWTYQNTPSTTQGRNKSVLTLTVTSDLNANASYNVAVIRNPSSTGQVAIEPTASPLVWNIKGGQAPADPIGLVTLDIAAEGVQHGGLGSTQATVTVRKLGDVDGNAIVNATDKLNFNKRLNLIATAYPDRCYDLSGDGLVNAVDKLCMNRVLNGQTVP